MGNGLYLRRVRTPDGKIAAEYLSDNGIWKRVPFGPESAHDPDKFNRVGARVGWLTTWTSIILSVVIVGPLVYMAWQIAGDSNDWYKILMVFGVALTAFCFYIILESNNRHWGVK